MDSSRLSTIPLLSQRDPRWANVELGTGGTSLGQEGCTITAACIAAAIAGNPTIPPVMNAALLSKGGYYKSNRLIFAALEKVIPQLSYQGFINCVRVPAPMAEFFKALDDNGVALVQVYSRPIISVDYYHWVLAYDKTKEGDVLIVDPWTGKQGSLTQMFGWGKWNPARIILAFAMYKIKEIK